jgi:hypothetical protein
MKYYLIALIFAFFSGAIQAQHKHHKGPPVLSIVKGVEVQPLLAQALRLEEALAFLGSALTAKDSERLQALRGKPHTPDITAAIQNILDPYTLAMIDINAEARVKVYEGQAKSELIQAGWRTFLVKVHNKVGSNAVLKVESPNSLPVLYGSTNSHNVQKENILSEGQLANRFLALSMYRNQPLKSNLSGLELEYAVVQLYSNVTGKREVQLGFNIGQGTQDIGFRNTINILFDIKSSIKVNLNIKDYDDTPVMASLIITDGIERVITDSDTDKKFSGWTASNYESAFDGLMVGAKNYRNKLAHTEYNIIEKRLTGVYPLPSRRIATEDEYPDFFFHPQIYRQDGEHVYLPPGNYDITYTRGPEYIQQHKQITVPQGVASYDVTLKLKRWINLADKGWYSSDHHIHSAGCSHYESPSEGVDPKHMWRQLLGEDLNFGAALSWGPSWYHQKQFFTGEVHPLSTDKNILRYDVEVSGFPSSHAGHLSLLNLKEDDYPNTTKVEQWPSWTLPILDWAKSQGGITGYSHSGMGLEPLDETAELPNYVTPKMDSIGANEYIVTVAHNAVDFYAAGNTPAPWELNMWYHTLNLGFTTRISGESDFPCVYDDRVGIVRSYTALDGPLNFDGLIKGIVEGRSYVTDGRSHIIDFTANGVEMGIDGSKLNVSKPTSIKIKANVAANLAQHQSQEGADIAARKLTEQPYWHLERARIGTSRKVPVDLVVNGKVVETKEIEADGDWTKVKFDYEVQHSSWIALKVYPSSHTNPIFITVDGQPILSKKSAEWAQRAVDQSWKMKSPQIREPEIKDAQQAYNKARAIYAQKELDATHD